MKFKGTCGNCNKTYEIEADAPGRKKCETRGCNTIVQYGTPTKVEFKMNSEGVSKRKHS